MRKITDDKILVTHQMMDNNGMINGDLYGVPVDFRNLANGLRWMAELDEDDFIIIENYFLLKADPNYEEDIVIPRVSTNDLEQMNEGVKSKPKNDAPRYRVITVPRQGKKDRYKVQVFNLTVHPWWKFKDHTEKWCPLDMRGWMWYNMSPYFPNRPQLSLFKTKAKAETWIKERLEWLEKKSPWRRFCCR